MIFPVYKYDVKCLAQNVRSAAKEIQIDALVNLSINPPLGCLKPFLSLERVREIMSKFDP